MTAQEKLENVKTVADFLQDALALKDNNIVKDIVKAIGKATPWAKEIGKNAPWVKDLIESAGDTLPIVAFFLKYAQLVMQEKDPNKQGYNACTLAYNRAVEEIFSSRSMQFKELKINPYQGVSILSKKNPNEIKMLGFKLETALSHDFVIYADEVFRKFAKIIDLKQDFTNQLLNSIHQSFLRNLRLLLVHPDTEKEFAAFKDVMELDDSQYQIKTILDRHLLYQSWLFNEAKVFQSEPFSLSHIYLETECGVLKWSEIKENKDEQFGDFTNRKKHEKTRNPFSEKDSERKNLLSKVIEYIGDRDFNEPIVIQGIAGSGKSSFTLRLVNELTRLLSESFATHWLSPEIKDHLLNLLAWEIKRSYQMEKPYVSEQCTQPISVKQWGYIRDGLADVWDWWAEGVLLRPQPRMIQEKRKSPQPAFDAPYVQELAEFCCPLDSEAWKQNLPAPVRVNTVDGRLGEAFFHLTAIIHGTLYNYQRERIASSILIDEISPTLRRRYQTQQLVKDTKNEDCLLIQFAPSGENPKYFRNCCNRINSSSWKSPNLFPSSIWAIYINLSGADLSGVDLSKADLSGADLNEVGLSEAILSGAILMEVILIEANLSGADLSGAYLSGADLSGAIIRKADLPGVDLSKADLSGADLSKADLSGANLSGADLSGAYLSGADLSGANISGADLTGANLREADFSGGDLTGATLEWADFRKTKYLTLQQIKQARKWKSARYDPDLSRYF